MCAHRVVLGQPDIAPLLSAEELGPLLPLDTQHSLEEACLSAVEVLGPGGSGGCHYGKGGA